MGIWKDKERKEWVYQFQYRRKNYGGRGFVTRREAATAREKRRKEVKTALKQIQTGIGFKEVASSYLDYSERKHAKRTYDYKALTYRTFLQMHRDIHLSELDPTHISRYLNTMPTNSVYNARRKDLSALFEWAITNYKLDIKNPCAMLKKMPHTPKAKYIPPEDVILKLIMAADPETDEQDLLLVVIHTLGRIDEVLRLKWEDVNFEKRTVTLWTRKRKDGAYEPDALPMGTDLYTVLMSRWKTKNQGTWVFYNEDTQDRFNHRPKLMAGLCKRAGIPPVGYSRRKVAKGPHKGEIRDFPLYIGFHALRHFMASFLADQEKVGVKAVSGLLRHKNLKTTEIYLHTIDEGQRIAIDQIQGKFTSENTKPLQKPLQETKEEVTNNSLTP